MAVEKLMQVDVAYENHGQHDNFEPFIGRADVRFSETKVQLKDRRDGRIVMEIDKADWLEIAEELKPCRRP